MERLLLRPIEAADLLGVGRSKVYDLIATRQIPSIRVGGSIRVPARALEQWVTRQAREQARTEATAPDAS